jgi:hypothetical protein
MQWAIGAREWMMAHGNSIGKFAVKGKQEKFDIYFICKINCLPPSRQNAVHLSVSGG